jgi:hypothetical protein
MTVLLAVAALLAADPTTAAQPSAAPAETAPAAAPVKVKKICKNLDGDTGTHFSRRVCKTQDEWTSFDRGEGRSADDLKAMGARR